MKRALYLQKTIATKQFKIKSSICILSILFAIVFYIYLIKVPNETVKQLSPYIVLMALLFSACYFTISVINHFNEMKRITSEHHKDKHEIIKEFIDSLNLTPKIENAIKCYDEKNCMAYEFLYEEIIRMNPPTEFSKELYYIYLNRYKDAKLLN